jgi:hypothetical protein
MADQKQGKNKSKKAGRNKAKGTAYRALHIREMNKVRRVLKSSGVDAAVEWAGKHMVLNYLRTMPRYQRMVAANER